MMKKIFALVFFIASFPALSEELDTPSYSVTIESKCAEGEVACDNVTYTGVNKKTGKSITLQGATWHTMCADGVTPCQFLGYRFENGDVVYTVSEDGTLEVVKDTEVLVDEQGNWR